MIVTLTPAPCHCRQSPTFPDQPGQRRWAFKTGSDVYSNPADNLIDEEKATPWLPGQLTFTAHTTAGTPVDHGPSQVVQATKLRSGLAGSHVRVVAAAAACLTLAVCLPWVVVVDAAALGELAQNPDCAGDAGFIGTHCVCEHPRTCTGSHCTHAGPMKHVSGWNPAHCFDCTCSGSMNTDNAAAQALPPPGETSDGVGLTEVAINVNNATAAAAGDAAKPILHRETGTAAGWHIRWVSVPGWNKAHVRRDIMAAVPIESEEVIPATENSWQNAGNNRDCVPINPDDPDGPGSWKEELQSLTILVVYQRCEVMAETYADEFNRRGRQGLVLLHLGNEIPFDTWDDSSFCTQRMYSLGFPVIRTFYSKHCAALPHVSFIPLGVQRIGSEAHPTLRGKVEVTATNGVYLPWHFFVHIGLDSPTAAERQWLWFFKSKANRRSDFARMALVERFTEFTPHIVDYKSWSANASVPFTNDQTSWKLARIKDPFQAGLCNSVFALVPSGNAQDTWRIMEALECGCIPVTNDGGQYFRHWWPEALVDEMIHTDMHAMKPDPAPLVRELLRNPKALEAKRRRIATLYAEFKRSWQRRVASILSSAATDAATDIPTLIMEPLSANVPKRSQITDHRGWEVKLVAANAGCEYRNDVGETSFSRWIGKATTVDECMVMVLEATRCDSTIFVWAAAESKCGCLRPQTGDCEVAPYRTGSQTTAIYKIIPAGHKESY